MTYATSDLHGYPIDSFLRLLEKAGFSDSDVLYVLGDVIDRNGDGGVAMLRWMMRQENVTLIRGNHESMMLECGFAFTSDMDLTNLRLLTLEQEYSLLRWNRNGCLVTLENLLKLKEEDPDELTALLEYDTFSAPSVVAPTCQQNSVAIARIASLRTTLRTFISFIAASPLHTPFAKPIGPVFPHESTDRIVPNPSPPRKGGLEPD